MDDENLLLLSEKNWDAFVGHLEQSKNRKPSQDVIELMELDPFKAERK